MVTKNITVTKHVFQSYVAENLVSAIIAEWPCEHDGLGIMHGPQTVKVQYDNCCIHIDPEDFSSIVKNVETHGLNMSSYYQPVHSPDCNVLDLGLFTAIQSLYYEDPPKNFEEITKKVEAAFKALPAETIKKAFLSLQMHFICIIECHGDNTFKTPHMQKDRLIRQGILPKRIFVTDMARIHNENNL